MKKNEGLVSIDELGSILMQIS